MATRRFNICRFGIQITHEAVVNTSTLLYTCHNMTFGKAVLADSCSSELMQSISRERCVCPYSQSRRLSEAISLAAAHVSTSLPSWESRGRPKSTQAVVCTKQPMGSLRANAPQSCIMRWVQRASKQRLVRAIPSKRLRKLKSHTVHYCSLLFTPFTGIRATSRWIEAMTHRWSQTKGSHNQHSLSPSRPL